MSSKESAKLLMLCGALQDISEICKNPGVSKQVVEVQLKIEKIASKKLINNK